MPMSDSVPEFPHHRDMLAYLEAYAEHNGLTRQIRFQTPVERVERVNRGEDGSWEVSARGLAPQRFDWIIVAIGH